MSYAEFKNSIEKRLISEFLKDFEWYLAFSTHFHWIKSPTCICKTDPIYFEKWIIKKWQKKLKKEIKSLKKQLS